MSNERSNEMGYEMSNQERYKHAVQTIVPSKSITAASIYELKEEKKMKKGSFGFRRTLVGLVAAVVLLMGVTGAAYATDIGGFRDTVDTWLYGEAVQAEIEDMGNGEFVVHYPNGFDMTTGGANIGKNGETIPFTVDDVKETLDEPQVGVSDDGTINVYYRNQIIDITDDVADDGIAHAKFKEGLIPTYVSIKWEGKDCYSMVASHTGYEDVSED